MSRGRGRRGRSLMSRSELVITKTLEEQGPGADTHWSTRSMAAAAGM